MPTSFRLNLGHGGNSLDLCPRDRGLHAACFMLFEVICCNFFMILKFLLIARADASNSAPVHLLHLANGAAHLNVFFVGSQIWQMMCLFVMCLFVCLTWCYWSGLQHSFMSNFNYISGRTLIIPVTSCVAGLIVMCDPTLSGRRILSPVVSTRLGNSLTC